jgi:hypothetical protein
MNGIIWSPQFHLGPLPAQEAILVCASAPGRPDTEQEVLTALVPGQHALVGLDPGSRSVFALDISPLGASFSIQVLSRIDPTNPTEVAVGPSGHYQYASCDSSARHCLLISEKVTVIELLSGRHKELDVGVQFPSSAADPDSMVDGDHLGGGELMNLSGKHLRVVWTGPREARIVWKGLGNKILGEYGVAISV